MGFFDTTITHDYYDKNGNLTGSDTDKASDDVFKQYIKLVKKYKITIESSKIYVDPYSIYFDDSGAYIRCYARFKVDWTGNVNNLNSLVFPGNHYSWENSNKLDGLQKGKYIQCLFDIKIDLDTPSSFGTRSYSNDVTGGEINSMHFLSSINRYGFSFFKTRQLTQATKYVY